jgi:hypothetical protein
LLCFFVSVFTFNCIKVDIFKEIEPIYFKF